MGARRAGVLAANMHTRSCVVWAVEWCILSACRNTRVLGVGAML